jgi:hypothetical protein
MKSGATSLSSQLGQLKLSTATVKLQPNQAPSSLLFSESVARTVDIDIIYSLAISGYAKLRDLLCGPANLYS